MAKNTPPKSRKLKVGVMRGGPSSEYDVSLKTGSNVLNALREKHEVRDIFIDKNGIWHIDGVARTPDRIFPHLDVIFNALHGQFGEDGRVQQIMDSFGIPYTGSRSLPSAIGMNKVLSKKFFNEAGIRSPKHAEVFRDSYDDKVLSDIWNQYSRNRSGTTIVKPTSAGSSVGISLVKDFETLKNAIKQALMHSASAIIEEFIQGREATCGVIEGSSGQDVYALHPVEIKNLSKNNEFWDYESKYDNDLHELICPGGFAAHQQEEIQNASIAAHKALGLRHYSRSDFIVANDGIYLLEINTLPGLTSASLFPRALQAADCSLADFLEHILVLAVSKR